MSRSTRTRSTALVAIVDSMTPKERSNHMIINGAAAQAHRQGQRDFGSGSEQFAEAIRADAQDDEEFYRGAAGSWASAWRR